MANASAPRVSMMRLTQRSCTHNVKNEIDINEIPNSKDLKRTFRPALRLKEHPLSKPQTQHLSEELQH